MVPHIAAIAFAEEIRDIKGPVYFPTNYIFLIIIGSIIFLIILILLTVFITKKIKRRKPGPPLPPPKAADQIAYEALEKLRLRNLPSLGKIKECYYELSGIARSYIENRFKIKAPEMTTEEFLASLRDSDILSGKHKNLLKEFLALCDIVKFAKYGPSQKEIDDSFNAAERFVDETKTVGENLEKVTVK